MSTIAKIGQLSVGFKHDKSILPVIDKLDFNLFTGETLALLGESGSGKSFTAQALLRLLPENTAYSFNSKIEIDHQDILNLPEFLMRALRGKRIAIIFQEPMTALNPVLKIKVQLGEAITQHKKLTYDALYERMCTLLHEVDLQDPDIKLNKYPHQLSGGEKQRIIIAMALANQPEILIADEPTTALDTTTQWQILKLLKNLQQNYRMSMLLITHDLNIVRAMADRICLMYAGQIIEQAIVNDFFIRELHPYAQQLLASRPSITKRKIRLPAIAGSVPNFDSLPSGCRFHPRCAHRLKICKEIEPQLQKIENRLIRCHLYPRNQPLVNLITQEEPRNFIGSSEEILLTVNNLSIDFTIKKNWLSTKKNIKVVDNLSFAIKKAQTLALVGESGSGKTTTSRAILGLISMMGGDICYRGKALRSLTRNELMFYRKNVQIIFQDPYTSLNPRMMVREIIAEGMVAQGYKCNIIQQKIKNLLDQVGLAQNVLTRYPHQFSGGQRQRIGIARALAVEPEIIICDEPTSALDISVQAQILNLLRDLQDEYGVAYLFITHNMGVVSYIADEVLVLRQGRCIEFGKFQQIFNFPKHAYTRALLSSIQDENIT